MSPSNAANGLKRGSVQPSPSRYLDSRYWIKAVALDDPNCIQAGPGAGPIPSRLGPCRNVMSTLWDLAALRPRALGEHLAPAGRGIRCRTHPQLAIDWIVTDSAHTYRTELRHGGAFDRGRSGSDGESARRIDPPTPGFAIGTP